MFTQAVPAIHNEARFFFDDCGREVLEFRPVGANEYGVASGKSVFCAGAGNYFCRVRFGCKKVVLKGLGVVHAQLCAVTDEPAGQRQGR